MQRTLLRVHLTSEFINIDLLLLYTMPEQCEEGNKGRLKLLFNFYVNRTIRRQDFGAKFNITYHNGAPVSDILNPYMLRSRETHFSLT